MKERLKAFVTSQEAAAEDVERKIDALLEAQHSAGELWQLTSESSVSCAFHKFFFSSMILL